ncbi:MAG: two-component system response regulator [Candidatus Omnitrophota bacterium]|jgi:putative two-component system response regulator
MLREVKSRIFCVDDEKLNLKLLRSLLEPEGYVFEGAENGKAALEAIERRPPDVILLDVMMPNMSGFEVLVALRANAKTRWLPVIMLTALQDVEARVQALEAGCDDFMSKPFDKVELLARVKSLVRIKTYHDQMERYEQNLEAEVARKTEKLLRALKDKDLAHLDTVYRLSRAAEYKDEDTGDHILRMSEYARTLAQHLGLKDKLADALFYAAPMHDVGKIGIPDAILLKPGKLDAAEWEIMKQHTLIGAEILKGSKVGFIKLAEVIALTHHEKWDGSGYPKGLRGDKIPLASRITAIADVYDALTSRRPYKEPFPTEQALKIIRESAGSHFDPRVADAFFACQEQILAIKAKYHTLKPPLLIQMKKKLSSMS